jgi:hypothetical protein
VRACRGRLAKQLQKVDRWWRTTLGREKFGGLFFMKVGNAQRSLSQETSLTVDG